VLNAGANASGISHDECELVMIPLRPETMAQLRLRETHSHDNIDFIVSSTDDFIRNFSLFLKFYGYDGALIFFVNKILKIQFNYFNPHSLVELRMRFAKMTQRHYKFTRMRFTALLKRRVDIIDNHIADIISTVIAMKKIGCKSGRGDIRQMLMLCNGLNFSEIKPAHAAHINKRNHRADPPAYNNEA
jgi:hypothetical protein